MEADARIKEGKMEIPVDMDGNKLTIGTRVAAADNVCGIKVRIGTVVGHTAQRTKVDFGDPKPQGKISHRLVKVFTQEK
jgi:hypothetical protein